MNIRHSKDSDTGVSAVKSIGSENVPLCSGYTPRVGITGPKSR